MNPLGFDLNAFRRSLKSMDTEERIDLAFYRPIGYCWALLAARLGVSPNFITIAAIFLGIAAGVLFYFPSLSINVVGMLLLIWANSFDSADGQLARLTHRYSRLGRILDGLCGDFWFLTIYLAIILREVHFSPWFGHHPWAIWLLGGVTAVFHAKQAAMADYYRQFHLFFLKGEAGSELDSARALREQLRSFPKGENGWLKRLTMTVYLNYTLQQEATSPAMQQLREALRSLYPDGVIPTSLREDFRRRSLPLMKFTNILTFNWRTITLFITLFIGQPWLYFVAELTVFNIILIYMINRHEHICRDMIAGIGEGIYD